MAVPSQTSHPGLPRARVLVIAPHSSYRTAPFLAAAQKLGIEIRVAAPGRLAAVSLAAAGLHLDLDDPAAALAAILREARVQPFTAILGTDDATTELAAQAACALALPHNPPGAVRFAGRKDLARARLSEAGVPVPRYWRLDIRHALAPQMPTITFPCVLKPVALSASRGVIRANNPAEFFQAAARIEPLLAQQADVDARHWLLVEEFIPGTEVALEGLLHGGELEVLAIFDKPDPLDGPFFEETYYITPSRLNAGMQAALRATISAACRAYGLREGPIHAECRINERGVWILEVAARTIGGLCGRLLRFGTGYGLEELVLAQAIGTPLVHQSNEGSAAGVLMIPIETHGILRRVEGIVTAGKIPFIEEVRIEVREGYELVPLPEGASYLGFIFARAPTPAAAEAALRAAHACLNIVVAPLWKAVPDAPGLASAG
jgi:biotin carboxylase